MDPCPGNCLYGDPVIAGTAAAVAAAIDYDGSKCGCLPCPNKEICHKWAPPWVFDSGRCFSCDAEFAKNLKFSDADKECAVCLEQKHRFVEYPSECGHEICFDCLRELFYGRPEPLDPRDYGFRTDCRCEYCTTGAVPCGDAMDAWEAADPAAYAVYTAVDELHDEEWASDRSNPKTCPLCRAHIADAPSNSWQMPRSTDY